MAEQFSEVEKDIIAGQILLSKIGRILEENKGLNASSRKRIGEFVDSFEMAVKG